MDPGEVVCDGSPHCSKKTHKKLKKGSMLTSFFIAHSYISEDSLCLFYMDDLGNTLMCRCTM